MSGDERDVRRGVKRVCYDRCVDGLVTMWE